MCRGKTVDGSPCDCEEYDPPQDTKSQSICRECGHGKSKHTERGQEQKSMGKKSVLDVFTAHAEKTVAERLPATDRVADFGSARDDALKGFRVKPEDSKKPKSNKKVTG
jgi:hypothetical protein